MVYKVFVSTAEDEPSRSYLSTAKTALWRINEFPISAVAISDLGSTAQNRVEMARRTLAGADIFIGIYGAEVGAAPPGSVETFLEIEYRMAMELGVTCLVFIAQSERSSGDERSQAFKRHLMENHVAHFFRDATELDAQIVLAVSNLKQTQRWTSPGATSATATSTSTLPIVPSPAPATIAPPPQPMAPAPGEVDRSWRQPSVETDEASKPDTLFSRFKRKMDSLLDETEAPAPAPEPEPEDTFWLDLEESSGAAPEEEEGFAEAEAPEERAAEAIDASAKAVPGADEFDHMVNRALNLAQDDLEQIVRRSLELHEAQRRMLHSSSDDARGDGWLRVRPIFGEPMLQTQFQADVFMIMPFRPQFNAIYEQVVRPVVSELNLTIKRGDEFSSVTGVIMQEVWAAINACRLVIVETTEINANVYYELGIAHTLGKPAILLSQATDVKDFPFDIRHLRFNVYENTIPGGERLAADLRRSILWILNDLDQLEKEVPQ